MLNKIIGTVYTNCGSVMSAMEIFQRLKMHEECVECLVMAGRISKAK
jgi:hypothetical protein